MKCGPYKRVLGGFLVHICVVNILVACCHTCLIFACETHIAVQGAPKSEEWAGWETAAAKEDKAGHTTDEWGKW